VEAEPRPNALRARPARTLPHGRVEHLGGPYTYNVTGELEVV